MVPRNPAVSSIESSQAVLSPAIGTWHRSLQWLLNAIQRYGETCFCHVSRSSGYINSILSLTCNVWYPKETMFLAFFRLRCVDNETSCPTV